MKKMGKRLAVMLLLGMLTFTAACGTSKKDRNEADIDVYKRQPYAGAWIEIRL